MGWTHRGPLVADQMALRRHNLALVLRHLRDRGPRSRARLAAETGLNKATVSSLVSELMERRLVRPGQVERGAVGRPGHTVELDGSSVCGLGAEVNVDHVAVLALDLGGAVLAEVRVPLDAARLQPTEVLDRLAVEISGVLDRVSAGGACCAGLTVGVSGLVDADSDVVQSAPNLGWTDVPVAQLLRERLGGPAYPLHVENEASLAAIAEAESDDAGTGGRDLVVVIGGVGVGGGIVADGRLVRGSRGFAGEIGHMQVDPDGRRCGCGRIGCWETVVGLRALLTAAADPDDRVHDPDLPLEERLAELDRRARLGDARTLSALHELGRWLGIGATLLANVLNPGAVVLGGYFAALSQWVVPAMEPELAAGVVAAEAGGCRIQASQLELGAVTRGAAMVSLDAVFDDPTRVPKVPAAPDPVESTGGAS